MALYKDQTLDELASVGNVAQFVSFGPTRLEPGLSRIAGHAPNHRFASPIEALEALLGASVDGAINIRSYAPDNPRSREFHYGLKSAREALEIATKTSSDGLFVIANETVDVNDGGVSGVVQGDVMEFAPDDTPRCVEKPGAASLSRSWGLRLLRAVYGFEPEIPDSRHARIEFSIHPKPRGWKQTHTLFWEYEEDPSPPAPVALTWPNRFSEMLGDKAFGLLIADLIGVPVPRTTVIGRRVAPFSFGTPTGSAEVWTRTCPRVQEPGRFTTVKGWVDPFQLLAQEDPKGASISSLLSQSAVVPTYSGAAITTADGSLALEGRPGQGDLFMLGIERPAEIPKAIRADLAQLNRRLSDALGPVRFEWVHDGERAWIVQLHMGATTSSGRTLVPGRPERWVEFDVKLGLERLRDFIHGLKKDEGIRLRGHLGLTSHVADIVRKAGHPAQISVY
jgi:hypothetical protein